MASSLFGTTGTPTVGTNSPDLNSLKTTLQTSGNPYATVQQLAYQGLPAAQNAMLYLQAGMTPKQAVLKILNERGIPVQQFLQNPLFK